MSKLLFQSASVVLALLVSAPLSAQEEEAGPTQVDGAGDDWYYRQPTNYQQNTRAIIHQKAAARAAHRQSRLEAQYYSGVHRARPAVNPYLPHFVQATYPFNYFYGPPLVSNNWGNTQVSVVGDGSAQSWQSTGRRQYGGRTAKSAYAGDVR